MMTQSHRQEAVSRAYVQAIAAQAGVLCSKPDPDYGIDLSLRAVERRDGRHYDTSVQLDLQLKSSTRATVTEAAVSYDLEVDTYNDLRGVEGSSPRILVLLVLPAAEQDWVSQSPAELTLRRCAYWLSLRGRPATAATSTIRVSIPLLNVFSAEAVRTLLQLVKEKKEL